MGHKAEALMQVAITNELTCSDMYDALLREGLHIGSIDNCNDSAMHQ
jgi:hypothetical protein